MPPDTLTPADIARRLSRAGDPLPATVRARDGQRAAHRAAVLLPLFRQNDRWRLLYIRRAENSTDRHSGEVAFPGGRLEPSDAHATAAALRETQEEIGLPASRVQILGRLPPFLTSSDFLVTPVVGLVPWPVALTPDPAEVARVFSLPLDWLADPRNHRVRPWRPPDRRRPIPVVFFDEREGERLWGVSARITLSLVEHLGI